MKLSHISFLMLSLAVFVTSGVWGAETKKPRFPASTYKTTAKIYMKDEYRMYDSAVAILEEGTSFYPNDAEMHLLLAKTYSLRNNYRGMGEQFAIADSLKSKKDKLVVEFGFDFGFPFGWPGIHLEVGHPNIAMFLGAGLSAQSVYGNLSLWGDEPEIPYHMVFSLGGVASPVPSKWPLRPRVMVLYTNESVYFFYRAYNRDNSDIGWRTFHKERFPGLCVLLELEINLQKLRLPGYKDQPHFRLELGYGLNKPFVGWDTINELESDIEDRIVHEQNYYSPHHVLSGGNFHHTLRVAFGWRFGI